MDGAEGVEHAESLRELTVGERRERLSKYKFGSTTLTKSVVNARYRDSIEKMLLPAAFELAGMASGSSLKIKSESVCRVKPTTTVSI